MFSRKNAAFCSLESETEFAQVPFVSTKELAMEAIKGLSENASWQEIEARIHLLAEVNLGYEQLQRGEGIIVTAESEFLNLARAK